MNAIVVYTSKTGYTKQYAEWIAESLGCEAVPLKKASKAKLAGYDKVIYGGWLMAGMICGLNKLRKKGVTNPVVFAVGMSRVSDELIATLRKQNGLGDEQLYYYVGGVDYDRLGFMSRQMLKMVKKSVVNKAEKDENDEYMIKVLSESCDYSDKAATDELVNSIK